MLSRTSTQATFNAGSWQPFRRMRGQMAETISQERTTLRVKRGCLEGRREAGDARKAGRSCRPEVDGKMKSCKK